MTHNALAEAALEAGTDPKVLRYIMKGNKETGHSIGDRWEETSCEALHRGQTGGSHLLPNLLQPCDERGAEDDWNPEGTEKLKHLAFADEAVLLSKKQTGLQDSINRLETGLERCGLSLSLNAKCATLEVHTVPRDRQEVINPSSVQQQGGGTHRNDSSLSTRFDSIIFGFLDSSVQNGD